MISFLPQIAAERHCVAEEVRDRSIVLDIHAGAGLAREMRQPGCPGHRQAAITLAHPAIRRFLSRM